MNKWIWRYQNTCIPFSLLMSVKAMKWCGNVYLNSINAYLIRNSTSSMYQETNIQPTWWFGVCKCIFSLIKMNKGEVAIFAALLFDACRKFLLTFIPAFFLLFEVFVFCASFHHFMEDSSICNTDYHLPAATLKLPLILINMSFFVC